MRTLLALVVCAVGLQAQQVNYYFISAATTKLTIQQPASNALQAQVVSASIYCAAAQTATEQWNGAAATATAGTVKKSPGTLAPNTVTAWTGSDVGTGTTGPVYNIPAGQTFTLGYTSPPLIMGTTGTSTNYSIGTSGTCSITINWKESPQ